MQFSKSLFVYVGALCLLSCNRETLSRRSQQSGASLHAPRANDLSPLAKIDRGLITDEQTQKVLKQIESVKLVQNEFLLKLNQRRQPQGLSFGLTSLDALLSDARVTAVEALDEEDAAEWYRVTLRSGASAGTASAMIQASDPRAIELLKLIERIRQDPNVGAIEPNLVLKANEMPNDPFYSSSGSWGQAYADQWGLAKINIAKAWEQTTGSAEVTVAIIDTGIDRHHPDLQSNIWINQREIPGNNRDDDRNGFKDDVYGWDFSVNQVNVEKGGDPIDDNGHGTMCAGIIGALGNNAIGIAGVNWTVRLMGVRFLNQEGQGTTVGAVKALNYAFKMGARIASNSWGGFARSALLQSTIKKLHERGMIIIAAAGNEALDALDFEPAGYSGVIAVGSSTTDNKVSEFSNIGAKIDLVAPGGDNVTESGFYDNILSLKSSASNSDATRTVADIYRRGRGTSFAAPFVSGVAALVLARHPQATNEAVRQFLRTGARDILATGRDELSGFGLLDAKETLAVAEKGVLAPFLLEPENRTTLPCRAVPVVGRILGANLASYHVDLRLADEQWRTIFSGTNLKSPTLGRLDACALNDGTYSLRLVATDTSGQNFYAESHGLEVRNFDLRLISPKHIVSKGVFQIFGDVRSIGSGFKNYTIEWAEASAPEVWSALGVSLTEAGKRTVTNGVLGTVDGSMFNSGESYLLRISAFGTNKRADLTARVRVDPDLVPGWPKLGKEGSIDSPILADVDGDGAKEIVYLEPLNVLHVYRRNGSPLPNFPLKVTATKANVPSVCSEQSLNAADLDGDKKSEIFVRICVARGSTVDSQIYHVDFTGKVNLISPSIVAPALARNALANGMQPGLASIDYASLRITDALGRPADGFPVSQFFAVRHSIATADLDADGVSEIVTASNSFDLLLGLYDAKGKSQPGWPIEIEDEYDGFRANLCTKPFAVDLDGDGLKEILSLGTLERVVPPVTFSRLIVYGWRLNGDPLGDFPMVIDQEFDNGYSCFWNLEDGFAVADLNRSGKESLIGVLEKHLLVVSEEGVRTIPVDLVKLDFHRSVGLSISDFNGDGPLDFLISFSSNLLAFNHAGVKFWQSGFTPLLIVPPYLQQTSAASRRGVVADLDGNGKLEVVGVFNHWDAPVDSTLWEKQGRSVAGIYVWELASPDGGQRSATHGWPSENSGPELNSRFETY